MIGWAIGTMLASTALMLLVLALRRPVAAAFGARVAYALWLLPALRMVLPVLPWASPMMQEAPVSGPVEVTMPVLATPAAQPDLLPLLAPVWLVGAILWFGWQMWRYRRFVAAALADATVLPPVGSAAVLASAAVAGPLAAGIRHRRIFVPADFAERYTPAERQSALAHEGAHHDRGDLLANLAGLVVLALHWWNPVAHWAFAAFRADQELACDATVLAGAAPEQRLAYGRAVLKSACRSTPAAACAMNHKSQLKQRIVMMKDRPLGALRRMFGSASALALVAGGLVLTAAGSTAVPTPPVPVASAAPAAPAAPQVRTIIIKKGQVISSGGGTVIITDDKPDADGGKHSVRKIIILQPGGVNSVSMIPAEGGKGQKSRVIIRCVTKATMKDGKLVTTDSAKDCENIDTMDINASVAKAMAETGMAKDGATMAIADAGMGMVMIQPTIDRALASARAAIVATAGLSADQRAKALAGIDEAQRQTAKDGTASK